MARFSSSPDWPRRPGRSGCPARASRLPRLSTMAMFWGRRPGTAAEIRLRIACTPSRSSRAAPAMVRTTLAWASCRSRAKGSRRGSTRWTRARADALDRADRAGELALHGAGLGDALLEAVGGQPVGAVENLVADRAARGQALLGKQQAGAVDLFGWDQDTATASFGAVRNPGLLELIDDLTGLTHVQIGVEQGHGPLPLRRPGSSRRPRQIRATPTIAPSRSGPSERRPVRSEVIARSRFAIVPWTHSGGSWLRSG